MTPVDGVREPDQWLSTRADGTVVQVSPLTGTVAWTVAGRSARPFAAAVAPHRLGSQPPADCAFCPQHYESTPPERTRIVARSATDGAAGRAVRGDTGSADRSETRGETGGAGPEWVVRRDVPAAHLHDEVAEFRRVPNLYPIVTYDRWRREHGWVAPREARERAAAYPADPLGRAHLVGLARGTGAGATSGDDPSAWADAALSAWALPLFASTHDLVIARRHLVDPTVGSERPCGSGDLQVHEHRAYIRLTIEALADLAGAGPFVRNVVAFQNWLAPAGASFDHLHKQVVALDEWGPQLEGVVARVRDRPGLADVALIEHGFRAGLVIARNGPVVALAGVGYPHPTIELVSTVGSLRPWEHTEAQVGAMADLLHAVHAATGSHVPTNEEWHYRPLGTDTGLPWRITVSWRVATAAGFEGATGIHVTPIDPRAMASLMVERLMQLRAAGRVRVADVGAEWG